MRRHERWIVSCAVLWLSACSTLPRPVVLDDKDPRQDIAVKNRWVGVTRAWSRHCPAPRTSDWKVRPLFPLDGAGPGLERSARKAKLHRFCVYEYKGSTPISKIELPPDIVNRLRSSEPDRVALSSLARLDEIAPKPFSERFFEQVQIPEGLPVADTAHVRLVFLDTQPDGDGIPRPENRGRSWHGYALAHIAGHLAGPLACRDGRNPCAVEIASRLALPLTRLAPLDPAADEDRSGGFRGRFVDLSTALWAEITNWDKTPLDRRPSRLVLNLSIGWDGEKYGGWEEDEADVTPDVQGILRALKAAADRDILVIAAAGNERSGSFPTVQPLLPGGWEKPIRRVKDSKGSNAKWAWKDLGKPLIYAVSGVDGLGRQLVNTRQRGEAPRVAYADHVAVPDLYSEGDPEEYTATLTGTSVASAVVSTIASVVWSYRPTLRPAEVMELLSRSGTSPMGRTHDFYRPPSTPVRQITMCRALAEAWPATHRPPFPTCGAIPAPGGIDLSTFHGTAVSSRDAERPFRRHPDLLDIPLIDTQPGVDPCPNCAVDPPGGISRVSRKEIGSEVAVVANMSPRPYQNSFGAGDSCTVLVELPPSEWGRLQDATLEIFEFDREGRRAAEPRSGSSIVTKSPLEGAMEVTFRKPGGPFQAALSFTLARPDDAPAGTPDLSIVSPLFLNCPE